MTMKCAVKCIGRPRDGDAITAMPERSGILPHGEDWGEPWKDDPRRPVQSAWGHRLYTRRDKPSHQFTCEIRGR